MKRLVALFVLTACSDPDPRYGEAALSSAAPDVSMTGTTFGQSPALELAPGCPGFLDPEQPAHVVHVEEDIHVTIRASSGQGPLALAVARGDEVRCDSDEGSGHSPALEFDGAGDYQVYVAALREPAALSYTLSASTRPAQESPSVVPSEDHRDISVTITSEPSGATVRDPDGRVVGTTPAMFVVSLPAGTEGEERSWALDLAGHESVTVTGRVTEGALVLHGQLPVAGPTLVNASATTSQPIRDYQTATLAVDIPQDCAIGSGEVEVDLRHSFIGDLRIVLHPPSGEEIMLHRHGGGGRRNLHRTWSTSDDVLRALVGRSTRGRWSLVVHDDAGADTGTLDRFDLRFTCGQPVAVGPSPRPGPEPGPPDPNVRPQPSLPELPTHAAIVEVLARLRPNIEQRCAQTGGNVRVYFTIQGDSGAVSRVSASGNAAEAEQRCVSQAVRGARFPRFRRSSLDVDYTYNLPAQNAQANRTAF